MALNLIILGPPGAGKGTQAERLARTRGIPKISTGDILREAVHDGTEVGKRAKAIMDRGELVSDEVMIGIVRDRLERPDAVGGFILDGFPRTVAQATALDGIMAGRDPLIVIDIGVPESELVHRLSTRTICQDCGANADVADGQAGSADRIVMPSGGSTAMHAQAQPMRCKRCGGLLVQRADDSAEVVLERLKVYQTNTKTLVDFYRTRPTFRSIDGWQSPDRVGAELAAAIDSVTIRGLGGSKVTNAVRGVRT